MTKLEKFSQDFLKNGWLIIDFKKRKQSIVHKIRTELLNQLRQKWIPGLESLDTYHLHIEDDDRHIEIQSFLSNYYQKENFGPMIIEENLDFFKQFIGPDLHVQKFPYLRIARPNKPQDNIGIHRDTHYGSSPYELSVSIPFTENGKKGSLGVVSGTHIMSEASLPVTSVESEDVDRGSIKHNLGFLYAPKIMTDEIRSQVKPIPLKIGQALSFSLSLVHGQEINKSKVTRFQSDIRIVNSMAPIEWSRSVHSDYYKKLCSSAVSTQAEIYLKSNDKDM